MGAAVIPNLDSIAEFRILTNNFDAEYGEFSGGQINVVTKSGTNAFHGDAFEFVRNTDLDARNYFSPTRGTFDQNQFGGTLGGPIRKNKIFFFADYQGTRSTQGVDTGPDSDSLSPGPHGQSERHGEFVRNYDASGNTVPTTVSGSYWASLLSQKLGYAVSAGEPYYTPGCTQCNVRFSRRRDSPERMVRASNQPVAIHSRAEQCEWHIFDLRLRQNLAGRQRRLSNRRQHAVGTAVGVLLSRRLVTGQSLPGRARRRERSGVQRALYGPRAIARSWRHENAESDVP